MNVLCISAQGQIIATDLATLLDANLREATRVEANRWIKRLCLVRYGFQSMRERFTYRGDSLWWFTEIYLHKMRQLEEAVSVILALAAAAFGCGRGITVEITSAPPPDRSRAWQSYMVGLTARLSRLKPGRRAAPASQGADVPIDVTLVLDQNEFAQAVIGWQYQSGFTKIATLLHSTDRLRVIEFARDVRETMPMQPVGPAPARELMNASPSETAPGRVVMGRPDQAGWDFRHDPQLRRASLFDAILFAMARLPEAGRRHIIVVFATREYGGVLQDGDLLDMVAARTEATIYAGLYISNIAPNQDSGLYSRLAVRAATTATGGSVRDVNDGVGGFKAILNDCRESYLLHYTLTGVPPAGWHTVVVRTPKFPDYTLTARSGYMAR